MKLYAVTMLLMLLSSCAQNKSAPENKNYRHVDSILAENEIDPKFEFYEEGSLQNEKEINSQLVKFSIDMLKNNRHAHKGFNKIPRDAHAKSHGCMKAKFIVNNTQLAKKHQLGIFADHAKKYDAYVRFSNNDHMPVRKDGELDMRGMAIKLLHVPGEKIMRNYEHETTQDFLMYGSNKFFVKNNRDYIPFIKGLRDGLVGTALKESWRSKKILAKALVQTRAKQFKIRNKTNPLGINYFSATPIRLGNRENKERTAIKYAVSPCQGYKEINISDKKQHNYMRDNLLTTLRSTGKACFDFKVQVQTHPEVMPIEDSTVAWPEAPKKPSPSYIGLNLSKEQKFSPYIPVAKIFIRYEDSKKLLASNRQDEEFCEDLSFSPWHAIPAHKPLGRTMRMRRDLYRGIADFRRNENGAELQEPSK